MIGDILDAIIKEIQAIPDFQVGTVMLKTDFELKQIGSYDMPMVLIDFMEAGESGQMLGGLTRMDWNIGLNSYNREPDALGDDVTGYSTGLLNVIDTIRRHFSKGNAGNFINPASTLIIGKSYMVLGGDIVYNGVTINPGDSFPCVAGFPTFTTTAGGYVVTGGWLTFGMWDILNKYGFRFTLSGVVAADALEGDGLVMGYRIVFDTVSFDNDTNNIQESTEVVETVTQINNPPYGQP